MRQKDRESETETDIETERGEIHRLGEILRERDRDL